MTMMRLLLARGSLPQQLKATAAFCLRRNPSPPESIASLLSAPPALVPIRHASSSSSNSHSSPDSPSQNQQNKASSPADPDFVSIQEMKGLIEQYDKGDMDAIPSIFEAILKRKLVQKKNNLESDPDLDQLLEGRRLECGSDSSTEDENLTDVDDIEDEETDLDSDWAGDAEKK